MTLPLSAPMLDLLVLSVIAEEDAYGYQIGRIIKRASATMKDSALYPILKRLQENHLWKRMIDSFREETGSIIRSQMPGDSIWQN